MTTEATLITVDNQVSPPTVCRPLGELGSLISDYHEQAIGLANSSIEAALKCGETLLEAKSQLPHGRWIPWLTGNCPHLGQRQMQKYMRLVKNWPLIEAKREGHPDALISVEGALSLIAESVDATPNTNSTSYLTDGSDRQSPDAHKPDVNQDAGTVATSTPAVDASCVANPIGKETSQTRPQKARDKPERTEVEILHRRIGVTISRKIGDIQQLFVDADKLFETHDEVGDQCDAVIDLMQQLNELLLDLQRKVSRCMLSEGQGTPSLRRKAE